MNTFQLSDRLTISISPELDDLPLSPEAFRVYFSILCGIERDGQFPSISQITARCFGKKYALGKTHTNLAMCELLKWNLIQGESGNYQVTRPDEWKTPGGAA